MNTAKLITIIALLLHSLLTMGQKQERQVGDTTRFRTLIPEEKQDLLKNMSMIANMNFAFRNEFVDGEYTESRFRNDQFRLEIRGQVHRNIYFRFRDRYTRAQTAESIDNLSRSTDLAYVRFDVNSKFSFSAGKMCADWGGFEFDYNPIDIYEYSDIIEYADNFLTGVGASYVVNPRHQLTVQVLDSRTKSFEELYGDQPNFTASKTPLAFVSNWRGILFGGKVKTIWSYSVFTEAENTFMHYLALGTELTLGKFTVAYDYKISDEGLDRTTIVSNTIPDEIFPYSVSETQYVGHWVHLHYRISEKINLAMFGMLDIARWKNYQNDPEPGIVAPSAHIRNAWGYIPTIEYYPWKDYNMRFFANFVGRIYEYSDYAKDRMGAVDNTTGRFNIGFVSPLGIF